ncbi:MAG: MFS transporter [Chloroflexi bacterium]|nr:MFS transporter [Chloroflexota bacterium]
MTPVTGRLSPRRDLLILGLVGFVTSFGAHAVAVNLPAYAQQVGGGPFTIGLLIAVYDFAEVIAKPVLGYWADKRGQVVTLWAGLAVFSLASLAFLVVDPRLLIAVRLFQGLGASAFSVVSVALVAAYFPQERGQSLGVYNALKGAGYVVAPVMGGYIVTRTSLAGLFVVSALIGLTVLALSFLLHEPARPVELDDDDDFSLKDFLVPR